jgi:hypothetical protein
MTDQNDAAPKSAPSDSYESLYMAGDTALARSKKRMPWWFFLIMALSLLAMVFPLVTIPGGVVAALPGFLFGFVTIVAVTLMLSHLRVVVTNTHLHIQLGLWGPQIALSQIEHISAAHYDWKRFGGWGLRISLDGTRAYSIPGGADTCIDITWRDQNGASKHAIVSCEDASEIVAAVNRARGISATTAIRVDSEATTDATPEEILASHSAEESKKHHE